MKDLDDLWTLEEVRQWYKSEMMRNLSSMIDFAAAMGPVNDEVCEFYEYILHINDKRMRAEDRIAREAPRESKTKDLWDTESQVDLSKEHDYEIDFTRFDDGEDCADELATEINHMSKVRKAKAHKLHQMEGMRVHAALNLPETPENAEAIKEAHQHMDEADRKLKAMLANIEERRMADLDYLFDDCWGWEASKQHGDAVPHSPAFDRDFDDDEDAIIFQPANHDPEPDDF